MAKIKLNSLLADIRGKMGGSVFSSNGAGYYVKVLTPPVNPRTPGQSTRRAQFAFLVRAWNFLSTGERDAWTDYAAQPDNTRQDWFGDPYLPASRAQFIIVNTLRLQAGMDYTVTPPAGSLPATLPTFSAGIDPQEDNFTSYIDPDAAFDASIEYVHASFCCVSSPSRYTPVLPLRFMAVYPATGPWPWLINQYVLDTYGAILTSGRWFIELTPVSDECRTYTAVRMSAALGEEV
jgi:hypothetical protein